MVHRILCGMTPSRAPRPQTALILFVLALFPLAGLVSAQTPPDTTEARLLRYPHIQGNKIAFVHGGDVWTASARAAPPGG